MPSVVFGLLLALALMFAALVFAAQPGVLVLVDARASMPFMIIALAVPAVLGAVDHAGAECSDRADDARHLDHRRLAARPAGPDAAVRGPGFESTPVIQPDGEIGDGAMAGKSRIRATSTHRRRAAARGLVRVEVQASRSDAGLIRAVAETLRSEAAKAGALRSALERMLVDTEIETAFDVFGSDLPDKALDGVFDQARPRSWREIEL